MTQNQKQNHRAVTSTGLQVLEQEKERRRVITSHLLAKRDHLAAVLPAWLAVEQVLNMLLQATLRNPELLECLPLSFVNAAFRAAELGLSPNGTEGYLIPYWNEAVGAKEVQFQPSYLGLLELCFRAAVMVKAQTRVFYANELMEVDYGTGDSIRHQPVLDSAQRGEMVGVYAYVKFWNGEHKFEIMLKGEVDLIRARSKAWKANGGPWLTDYEEMAKKTVLRRLLKTCRRSRSETGAKPDDLNRLDRALEIDNEDYDLGGSTTQNQTVSPAAAPTRQKQAELRDRLQVRREAQKQIGAAGADTSGHDRTERKK